MKEINPVALFRLSVLGVGIPVDRDHPFRFIVTSDSGLP